MHRYAANNFISTESYRTLVNKLDEKQQLQAKFESQTERLKKELETSQHDCKIQKLPSWNVVEQHTDQLSVSLIDKDKRAVANEMKKRQTVELTNLQDENKVLRKRLSDVETDLAGHRQLLQNNIGNKQPVENQGFSDEILRTLNDMKEAVTSRPTHSVQDFEKNIAALGEKVMQSNAALAKSEEVLKNSNKFPHTSSVQGSQTQSSSAQQQPTKPKTQTFASKFSKVFTTSKANSKPSNTAHQESERRTSTNANIPATPRRPQSLLPPIPARSSKDSK